jgi:hypothetical protein
MYMVAMNGNPQKSPPIDLEKIRQAISYDPDTGVMKWKIKTARTNIGSVAGTKGSHGYLCFSVFKRQYLVHRLAWMLHHNIVLSKWEFLDHIDRNKLNNKMENLRLATPKDNNGNVPILSTNTSGYRGVSWDKNKNAWACYLWNKNKKKHLGMFPTAEIAAKVYDKHAKEYFGEYYSNVNFPEET